MTTTLVVPVILCGGAGTRLWPASSPDRPKPFATLVGGRSGFQDALARGVAAASGATAMVVGAAHDRALIEAQAREIGTDVRLVLEPGGPEFRASVGRDGARSGRNRP